MVSCSSAHMHAKGTAKVWRLARTGNIAELTLQEDAVPSPKAGQAIVAVKAIGINFADVFTCLGLYQAAPKENVIPGLEFAGVITDLGPDFDSSQERYPDPADSKSHLGHGISRTELQIGDQVLGACRFGSYATCLNVPTQQLLKMPKGWSLVQGAAFLVQSLTAYYGLKSLGDIKEGSCVLVQSAAGGCGMNALAICLAVGATPVGTVGTPDKVQVILDRFPALQPEQIIVRNLAQYTQQLQSALQSVSKEGFDIVLDAVSGDYFQPSYDAMARGGRHVIFGAANWTPTGDKPGWLRLAWQFLRRPRLDPISMIGDNKSIMAFNLIWMFDKALELANLATELQALHLPPPHVGETFSFDDAPSALRRLQTGKTVGKVVLEVGDNCTTGLL